MTLFSEADIKITTMKYCWQVSRCGQWEPCMCFFKQMCYIKSKRESFISNGMQYVILDKKNG